MSLRLSVFAAAAVALFTVTGCGVVHATYDDAHPASSSASPSPTEAREGRLLAAPEAKAALPTLSELTGTGWVEGTATPNDPDPGVTPAECASFFIDSTTDSPNYRSKITTNENVQFTNRSSDAYTDLTVEIASWAAATDSALPIDAASAVDRCPSITTTDSDGSVQEFTAKRLTALPIGEKQIAFQLTADVSGTTVYLSAFETVVGHNLITVVQTSTSPTDPIQSFEPVVKGVLADLSA